MDWLSKLFGLKAAKPKELNPRNIAQAAADDADILDAWKFAATMNVSTPLESLLRHGETADAPTQVPPKFGIWLPVTKSWREQGIDVDELPPATMASQVGQIPQDGGDFLPFLIEYRRIVEAPDNGLSSMRIDALKERYPNFASALEPKLNRKKRKAARR